MCMMPVMTSRLISRTQEENNDVLNASFDSNDSVASSPLSSFDGKKKYGKRGTNKNASNTNISTSHYNELQSINNSNIPKSNNSQQ